MQNRIIEIIIIIDVKSFLKIRSIPEVRTLLINIIEKISYRKNIPSTTLSGYITFFPDNERLVPVFKVKTLGSQ